MSSRLVGSFIPLKPNELDFTPSDAVSLALLWDGRQPGNEPVAHGPCDLPAPDSVWSRTTWP
jgi:hypothetical protein